MNRAARAAILRPNRYAPPRNAVNLVKSDLSNPFWTRTGFGPPVNGCFFEDTSTGNHRIGTASHPTRAAGSALYKFRFIAEILPGRQAIVCQILDGAQAQQARVGFNLSTGLVFFTQQVGTWFGVGGMLTKLPGVNNLYFCEIYFTTDPSSTDLALSPFQLYSDAGVTSSYTGVVTNGASILRDSIWLFAEPDPTRPLIYDADRAKTGSSYYNIGNYLLTNNAFGSSSLTRGVDFTHQASIIQPSFPNKTRFSWTYPQVVASPIYGFNSISYGDYNGDVPISNITSRQLSGIAALTVTHDVSCEGPLTNFTFIHDIFLTTATGGTSTKAFEIAWYLRPSSGHAGTASQVGSNHNISGVNWDVWFATSGFTPPFIQIFPTSNLDIPSLTLDVKATFDYLGTLGIAGWSTSNWFNGMSTGFEPLIGPGSATIKSLSHTYS